MDLKAEIDAADGRIRPYVRETPVEGSRALGGTGRARVFLKMENLQITGSFKLRGAMNKLLSITPGQRAGGVVAASSGNHGAAVAFGLKALGIPGVIYVPENASPAKVASIRAWGAEVRTHATDSGVTEIFARRRAEEEGLTYISPYNDPVVVAGQGTIGRDSHHTLIEGAAAVAVAGFLKDAPWRAGRSAAIVLCGANISRERLKDAL